MDTRGRGQMFVVERVGTHPPRRIPLPARDSCPLREAL
jgi:hypothetical protein